MYPHLKREPIMRVPIVDIGNSKGIRIPQAILRQVRFANEVEMDVGEGRITLRKSIGATFVPDFSSLAKMDDLTLQAILRKINGSDLITALVGAEKKVKDAVYRNLSPRAKAYVAPTVARLEKGDVRDLIIERSRNVLCEALMEVVQQ
jgi:antitoxin component of MazEF toxin-antitoxin module